MSLTRRTHLATHLVGQANAGYAANPMYRLTYQ